MFSSIETALEALQAGKPVLVLDDEGRENEGDAIMAGSLVNEQWLGWMVRHTSGYLCAPLTEQRADELDLPIMVPRSTDPLRTAYTISVDAASGVTTGISAADRARTVRVLADPDSRPEDLARPGHILPLRAKEGGVLTRRGHTEATVDLCRLAGLAEVGLIGELVHDDGSMMRTADVLDFGRSQNLPVITIEALVAWRRLNDLVVPTEPVRLPTPHGEFQAIGYRDSFTGDEHIALVSPRGLTDDEGVSTVRMHSQCLTGDVFGSKRCDCGEQLERAMDVIAQRGGVLLYLDGHEGRGVGLVAKLQAYRLQEEGLDTVDAQTALGLPVDARSYDAAVAMLNDLGVRRIRLLTNNPLKADALTQAGAELVAVEGLVVSPSVDNAHYLATKKERMGHRLILVTEQQGA